MWVCAKMEAEWKSMLVDMGFEPALAEKALRATNASSIEAAIEYIQKLQEQEEEDGKSPTESMDVGASNTAASQAPPVLTAEEIKARDAKIEQLRLKVTAERAEKERVEALEREKQRRGRGQELSAIREKFNEEETKRLVAACRKEKDIEVKERDRLRALIEQDKLNRKHRQAAEAAGEAAAAAVSTSQNANSAAPSVSSAGGDTAALKPPPPDHKETRLQIRQLNGERLVQTFQASEPLSAVRLYCELNRTDKSTAPFVLIQPHPRREYSEDDYLAPLKILDLVPSGTLQMTKPRSGGMEF